MTRLPLAARASIPDELMYMWDALARGEPDPRNVYRVLGNNPEFLRAWTRFGNAVWGNAGLDLRQRELAILRAAYRRKSRYEWHQHVRAGQAAGLSAEAIQSIPAWRESPHFSEQERALLAFVDTLCDDDPPSDSAFAEFQAHFPAQEQILGVTVLVLFYGMIARFLEVMDVEPEEPFVGWPDASGVTTR